MSSSKKMIEGVVLTAGLEPTGALVDGEDVSWLSKCRVGDDQRREGACTLFSLASHSEIVTGIEIEDAEVFDAYKRAQERFGIGPDEGMSFHVAFRVAQDFQWFDQTQRITPVNDLSALAEQPMLAAYRVTAAWNHVRSNGCLDHSQSHDEVRGYHAVVVVAAGRITKNRATEDTEGTERFVYIENSWGKDWGWKGIGVMSEELHLEMIEELWVVR